MMAWVRIDDAFFHHPKLSKLEWLRLPAIGLHVLALCWCNANLTNGKLSNDQALILAGDLTLLLPDAQPDEIIKALVAARMWKLTKAGYVIHDYLKYQPSRQQVLEDRKATAIRVKRHRNAVTPPLVTPPVTPDVTAKYNNPVPVPVPVPVPIDLNPSGGHSARDEMDEFLKTTKTHDQVAALVRLAKAVGLKLEGGPAAAIVRDHGHGQAVVKALFAYLENRGVGALHEYMLGVLRNAEARQMATVRGERKQWAEGAQGAEDEGAWDVLTPTEAAERARSSEHQAARARHRPDSPSKP